MVTQWVCGEVLELLDARGEWLRIRGPDDYVAWIDAGGVLRLDGSSADAWRDAATARSLGTRLVPAEPSGGDPAGDRDDGFPRSLPWGARAAEAPDGALRLPTGRRARPRSSDRVVPGGELRKRFPAEPEAVLRTATRWEGVPYLWGGRTRAGADCSGFVQAVYGLHGVSLPRDSGDQLAAGPKIGEDSEAGDVKPPDPGSARPADLLFFGPDEASITHVALSLGGGEILHAAAPNGQVRRDDLAAETPLARDLRQKLVGRTRPLSPR